MWCLPYILSVTAKLPKFRYEMTLKSGDAAKSHLQKDCGVELADPPGRCASRADRDMGYESFLSVFLELQPAEGPPFTSRPKLLRFHHLFVLSI